MSSKQKSAKTQSIALIEKEQRKEQRMIAGIVKRENLMKWLMIGIIILLLLLLLFVGYATDWLRGVRKDSATGTPGASSLESAAGLGEPAAGISGATSNNSGTKAADSNTAKDSTSSYTSTTTNNSSTTNTTTSPTPSSGLLSLYSDNSVGDDIATITENAAQLGLTQTCRTEFLVQVCEFTDGVLTVTTKNLVGTGLVTSLTNDF